MYRYMYVSIYLYMYIHMYLLYKHVSRASSAAAGSSVSRLPAAAPDCIARCQPGQVPKQGYTDIQHEQKQSHKQDAQNMTPLKVFVAWTL